MDWDIVAPLIGSVSLALITALTVLLWPLSRRLAHLVEVVIQEKTRLAAAREGSLPGEDELRRLEGRIARLEEENRFLQALTAPDQRPEALRLPALPPQA